MAILSHPAFGPRASLAYITVGALLDVWTGVWYYGFAHGDSPVSNNTWFWITGLFLTGIVLMAIGFFLGPISQFARRAELPPDSVVQAEARIQQTAAANPAPVVPPVQGTVQPNAPGTVQPANAQPVPATAPTSTARY